MSGWAPSIAPSRSVPERAAPIKNGAAVRGSAVSRNPVACLVIATARRSGRGSRGPRRGTWTLPAPFGASAS